MNIVKRLYEDFKACIKWKNELTEFFPITHGVLQGEALSPLLFSMFIIDMSNEIANFNSNDEMSSLVNVFLYADDLTLVAETPEKLQSMLNKPCVYCTEWNLTVNTSKTKVVVFRNGGNVIEDWMFNGQKLSVVDCFNYLGLTFNYNGNFKLSQKVIAAQGRKALFCVLKSLKDVPLNAETKLYLYETYVKSILNYACETWGFNSAPDVKKIAVNVL